MSEKNRTTAMTINENSDSQHDSNTLDIEKLREQIKLKYREVATTPDMEFHFHTGRKLAEKLGYSPQVIDEVCATGVESFAGVGNPFSLRTITKGEKVVDVGSGAGFDSFVAASLVGDSGEVIGVDMTEEMLVKANRSAKEMSLDTVNFKEGIIEDLPITDGWADAVISNGVINLCADKRAAFSEIFRILKPGGYLQFADIANSNPIPQAVIENIDLWTA